MAKGSSEFFSQIESVGPARFAIYLGFILIPLSNAVAVTEWNRDRDPAASATIIRPDYPIGNFLLLTGLTLIFLGPWLARGTFLRRLAVFGITVGVFLVYMVPMTVLFVESGVPFQD